MITKEHLSKASTISRLTLALLSAATVAEANFYQKDSPPQKLTARSQESLFSHQISTQVSKDLQKINGADTVLIFHTGGLGSTPLKEAPGWPEIIQKISDFLKEKGYRSVTLENPRHETLLRLLDLPGQNLISPAAQETALRIKLLKQARPDLKIILIGWSSGASFVEEIMHCLKDKSQVFAIEVGRPFSSGITPSSPEHTLTISTEGDAAAHGNIPTLIKTNFPPPIYLGEGGDFGFGPLRVDISLPHHLCFWPEIGPEIEVFLAEKFPLQISSLSSQR